MHLGFAHRIGDGVQSWIKIGDLLNRFNDFPINPLTTHQVSEPYKPQGLVHAFFKQISHPFEIMNPMKISSTLLVLLMLSGLTPVFGQSMPKPATDAGGAILDEKAHLEAKTKWIKENPEAYRKAGGDPEMVNNYNGSVVVDNTMDKKASAKVAFQASESYAVVSAVAVPLKGKTVSAEQLKAENKGLAAEYPAGKVEIQRDAQGRLRVYAPDKLDLLAEETRSGSDLTWNFKDMGCESCVKSVRLTVEEQAANKVVYLMHSEDESASVAYRLTLQPIQQR